jgi:uncharacterized membrane protein (UPF0127 family)
VILGLFLGCGATLSEATVSVDGHPVVVELAATAKEREIGLMDRDPLGDGRGMLFVYAEEKPRSYWMKNTRIPLSIAYADRTGTIVKILDMKPHDTTHYQSLYPAMYALEVDQGWFSANGVEAGDKITEIPALTADP